MKLLSSIFIFCVLLLVMSCSSSDNEEIVYKLTPLDYSDLHRYRGISGGGEWVKYDTIEVNKSDRMLDTITKFITTETLTTLSKANNIRFAFLEENKMKYLNYNQEMQIIADRFDSEDFIYVLKNNNLADSVFVVRNKGELSDDYFRILSVYRFKQGTIDKEAIVENEILELNNVLSKLDITEANLKELKEGEYLIWANVYYRYQ